MRSSIVKVFVCLAYLFSFAHAQQPATSTTSAQTEKAASAASKDKDSSVNVYVYRYKQYVGGGLSPSVYCDETELARMENGRFFVVKLAPGKHTFRSNDKQSGVEQDLQVGHDYYIRVEIATGFLKGHGRVVSVAQEQGSYEIKQLKQLGSDKVKDTQRVVTTGTAEN